VSAGAWCILGAVGESLFWVFAIAWLLDVIAAQRQALTQAQSSIRLMRHMRDESDTQVRVLLGQNERLALQLIDRAASPSTGQVVALPSTFFDPRRES